MRPAPEPARRSKIWRVVGCAAVMWLASSESGFASLLDGTATPFVTLGALTLACTVALWAAVQVTVVRRLRQKLRSAAANARAEIGIRDALLAAGRDPLVAWRKEDGRPHGYGGAENIIESCFAGPDAMRLAEALDALSQRGVPFQLAARDEEGRAINLRGRAVGGSAAIWIENNRTKEQIDFRSVLDVLPIPVWLRDKAHALVWGNKVFLDAVGQSDLESAVVAQAELVRSDRDLAAAAARENHLIESRRFAVVGGQRRALVLTHAPIAGEMVAVTALDSTELANVQARLQQHIDAHADTLDKLATAVSIFDRERKLAFYNGAFARLWSLPESWLDLHPSDEEILDRLREARKLPEQRDWQAWKRSRLALYEEGSAYIPEDLWYLPGGKTLRVIAQPHPFGGLTFLYEDVTEKLALESSYKTLTKVQSATLDTLSEAVAVFGPDARLKLHNAALARLWELDESDLAGEPHAQKIAEACATRFGDTSFWQQFAVSISSGTERSRNWGYIERTDGKVLQLTFSALPDGATLITFGDVTDRFRIENALRDRAEALEAADRLKSDFVHHASFLFRDPLNAVHGFASMLASGQAGPLSKKQAEYVGDILAASDTLADVTSDILDLALIDSGVMKIELARIDLNELLSRVADTLRKHAESLEIVFRRDWGPDVGAIVADGRRLKQVVFNLLSNAFKYTPRGGTVTLSAAIADEEATISVVDSGPGIAAEVKANVFDHFAAKGRSGRPAGAGLGLALVNRFVELHGGWVEIESSSDRGTIVRCHIPRRIPESERGSAAIADAG